MTKATKATKTKTIATSGPAAPATDIAGAVARVKGEGEPEGDRKAPLSNAERQRRFREKRAKAAEPVVINVTEADIEVAAQLGRTVWDIAAPFVRCRALNDDQANRLGRALAPLVQKYMPILGDWQYEAAAVLCVMALARETALPRELPTDTGDEPGEGS